jgi:UDP-N-acetylmuramoylalanine--D-glutamate ligase
LNAAAKIAIIGLGKTGISCINYYLAMGAELIAYDEFTSVVTQLVLRKEYPEVEFYFSPLDFTVLKCADKVVVSPGVDLRQAVLQRLMISGKSVIGDVEIFAQQAKAPIIAITGTNGKTTVVHWLEKLLLLAGLTVRLAGNVGVPALSLLGQEVPDYYVLELSSFQLESTVSLRARVAAVINIDLDHLDRYDSLDSYRAAKHRIYDNAEFSVYNADENETPSELKESSASFSMLNNNADYHLVTNNEGIFLAKHGEPFFAENQFQMLGKHVAQNALVVSAISDELGIDKPYLQDALATFTGLQHRLELVIKQDEVAWYNDSKATNESAAVSAITTIASVVKGKIILIAGGDAKDSTFDRLSLVVKNYVSNVILLGQDKDMLAEYFSASAKTQFVSTIQQAVQLADDIAVAGDAVLLSPGCSSLDMFSSYTERGDVFAAAVNDLCVSLKGVKS